MRSTRKFALIAGSALALVLAAPVSAHPEGGWGAGCGEGAGPLYQGGYEMGPGACGMGPGAGMGMGRGGMGMGHGMGPGYGMGHGMGPGARMGNGMGMGGVLHGHPGDVGERLSALKSSLKITDAQQAAWQGFVDSATKQAQDRLAWMEKMHTAEGPQSAPGRLTLHNEAMKQRQAGNEAVAASLKTLYDVLTPEQRAVLDRGEDARAPRYSRR